MKNLLIWILGIILGTALGYWLSILLDLNQYLTMAGGAIIGSSFAITLNLRRGSTYNLEEEISDPDNSELN